jgi:anti-sigma factor ChrR (cupin superfamily)
MTTPAPPDETALDAEFVSLLDAALVADTPGAPDPADHAAAARVRQRLQRRIAAGSTPRHVTVQADSGDWQRFGTGIDIKVLYESGGVMSYLLRMAAGAQLPAHRHPVDEECMVLEGEVRIGALRVAAGGFHLGRKDMLHDVLHTEGGALIFLRGAAPEVALVI